MFNGHTHSQAIYGSATESRSSMLIREGKSMGKFGMFQGYNTLLPEFYDGVLILRAYSLIHPFRVAHDQLTERNKRYDKRLSGLKISSCL